MIDLEETFPGGCACRRVQYQMISTPMFVHCCHCRWCQRESGAAFALNALIEADRVQLLQGEVTVILTPTMSGKGQRISRCPKCLIALWSNYVGAGDRVRFVRVGTLDLPDRFRRIFTYSRHRNSPGWLSPDIPAVPEYYKSAERWPKASLERRAALQAK